jgi:hypothetical protein
MDNFYNNWGVLVSGKDARVRIAITLTVFAFVTVSFTILNNNYSEDEK